MAFFYMDSSALTKHYVTEKGAKWVNSVFNKDNFIFVARITEPEVASALTRRVREGTLSLDAKNRALRLLNYHIRNRLWVLEIDAAVCKIAISLLGKHPLRAYDSVQLATAFKANEMMLKASKSGLTFLTSDVQLLNAALAEGLLTDNPERY